MGLIAPLMAANERRSRDGAAATVTVVRAALVRIDQATAPAHLVAAGRMRIEHPDDSLTDLGARFSPPLTKDAVAGRIRRLLKLAGR